VSGWWSPRFGDSLGREEVPRDDRTSLWAAQVRDWAEAAQVRNVSTTRTTEISVRFTISYLLAVRSREL
jgi:hypothetical protein